MGKVIMAKWIIKLALITTMFVSHNGAWAEDVSNRIKPGYQASMVISCITRLEIYADSATNMLENPDPDFAKKLAWGYLLSSIPYRDNVRRKAFELSPFKDDWDTFYQLQVEQVDLHVNNNLVSDDTFRCVRDLMRLGVIVNPK
jgi:hypothetical protein